MTRSHISRSVNNWPTSTAGRHALALAVALTWVLTSPASGQGPLTIREPQSDERVSFPVVAERKGGAITEIQSQAPARWAVLSPLGFRGLKAVDETTVLVGVPTTGRVVLLVTIHDRAPQVVVIRAVGQPGPDDPPEPEPDKPDPPKPLPVPDGWNGLTKSTVAHAASAGLSNETASEAAKVYLLTASQTHASLQAVFDFARAASEPIRARDPAFKALADTSIPADLERLYDAQKLNTRDHAVEAIRAIGTGFELYAKGAR